MRELTFASALAAEPGQVWTHATSMAGINEELGPWLTMRPPRGWRHASIVDLPLGVPLGRAWILLGGVLPVDYDDLTITEHQPGRLFQERSSMLSARRWEHRRTVEPMGAGSRVTDVVGVEGRLVPTTLVAWVVAHLFRHRHRRLVARFGKARACPSAPASTRTPGVDFAVPIAQPPPATASAVGWTSSNITANGSLSGDMRLRNRVIDTLPSIRETADHPPN